MHLAKEKLNRCYESIREKIPMRPKVALILGSGLGEFADEMQQETVIDYAEIQDFPVSTVPGHKGRFVFGYIQGVPAVVMQGRVHYYEGYPITDVVLPVRLMRKMGAEILFLTNAAGGMNPEFRPGDFMMITDQISNFVPSPLIGPNLDDWGPRFCDMSNIYRKELQEILKGAAKDLGISLKEGVYIQLTGPNYETPAEVRMCRILGADAVGMSTACEAVAANHCGMQVCGISCITNMACGITDKPLSHEEVQKAADEAAPHFKSLLAESIRRMGSGTERRSGNE